MMKLVELGHDVKEKTQKLPLERRARIFIIDWLRSKVSQFEKTEKSKKKFIF